ncbi:protein-export chaperone SecB [Moraxella catarrhalis]|jgi:protein-export chaperone secB|uniref:Protein-export protein SecB n=3 Tax=Gammaproteobacteria TaxID=1236 RepID=A0A198UFY2_MORCA|nr:MULTISPECIES: protein-export chaperone SecB [Moraxella]ADG61528.1 protein translocase chaperone SecB [Moraxella catarrhalis BBH18]AIK00770.1 protein-export chaperone SecB [Moraxella catarrhalis]AIT43640.1 Protein-export protein secB [Moraxella catarrhalis]ARB68001.1 protein-export chaperone SecB [Moraxella catarrhalis]ARE65601.1 preprotein translocase subunit SecB [Moraxella catarrhalis]
MSEELQPQLGLERIYTKDISFEVPNTEVFTKQWQPETDVSISTSDNDLDEDYKEVVLTVSVTAKLGESVAFIAEVQQAGIFLMRNIPEADMPHLLQAYCPNILFPYAREAISDIVTRGSFPQLLLAPVNFEQAFLQSQLETQNDEGNA